MGFELVKTKRKQSGSVQITDDGKPFSAPNTKPPPELPDEYWVIEPALKSRMAECPTSDGRAYNAPMQSRSDEPPPRRRQ